MSKYISLHTHSDYSPQDGACSVEEIAKKASQLGMNSVALTDHGRCGGLLKFKAACENCQVKPIFGSEFYVAPMHHTLREKVEGHKTSYHLTLLAKNRTGLQNLLRLSSIGWINGFYYHPRIDDKLLEEYKDGLIALSGCASGRISNRLLEGKADEAQAYAKKLQQVFGEDFYIEAQNHNMPWQKPLKGQLFDLSRNLDVPIVATQDSHFIEHDSAILHQKICKLAAGDLEFGTTEMYFKSEEEMQERFSKNEWHAIERTTEVADKCNVNWQHNRTIWPILELPEGRTPAELLREKTRQGMEKLGISGKEKYEERLSYELGVIERMGFPTYFLVVADFIQWAKDNGISCGPGRGSAAGSLVSFCLGITEIDPIKYGLFFERFLNEERVSLPDIDTDISPRGRKRVVEHLSSKYGEDKIAQIGTYAQMKPRGSLRDFARVCGYEPIVGDKLANLIPPDVAGKQLTFEEALEAEPRLSKTQWPEVVELAKQAEGLRTKAGVHAAGVVISDSELKAQVPLFRGKGNEIATQFDMHDVEDIGLVKYDLLGLINLDIIQDTLKFVEEIAGEKIEINKIDEEDQAVFENIFHKGRLDGIFQFETSSGFKELCMRVRPRSIQDLAIITSLFRPGPLSAGMADDYVKRRNGEEFEYLCPELKPILQNTYGLMILQEQIMKVCTDIAGYTAAEADSMRKVVGKKLVDKMPAERSKFIKGCVANNISEPVATQLFEDIEGFSRYGFNAAHAISYSVISYRTAWLKHYYPQEFYCSLFNNTMKEQPQLVRYIHACKEDGVPVEPPDVNRSQALFSIDNGTILFGLGGIKGIGAKACERILENREDGFSDLGSLIRAGATARDIRPLAMSGALESITHYGRTIIVEWAKELISYYKKLRNWEERKARYEKRQRERQSAATLGKKPPRRLRPPPDPPEEPEVPKTPPLSKEERLDLERETLGFYLTGHPLDSYAGLYRIAPDSLGEILAKESYHSKVSFPAVISVLTKKRTRKGKDMAVLQVEDKTARTEVTVFPFKWKKVKDILEEGQIGVLVCETKLDRRDDSQLQLIFKDFKRPGKDFPVCSEPKDLYMGLPDGTVITFRVSKETSLNNWQQAAAILDNIGAKHDNALD